MTDAPILSGHDAFPTATRRARMILTFMEFEGIVENGEFLVHDLHSAASSASPMSGSSAKSSRGA